MLVVHSGNEPVINVTQERSRLLLLGSREHKIKQRPSTKIDALSQTLFPLPSLTLHMYISGTKCPITISPPSKKFQIPCNVQAFFSNFGLMFFIHSLSKHSSFLLPSKWHFIPPLFVEGFCNSGKSKDEDQK